MRPIWAILTVFSLSFALGLGQRLFYTIDPKELDEKLAFDINISPYRVSDRGNETTSSGDVNFSPNLVFSPDSSTALVAFPKSDKVLVFDPKSGEIRGLVTVGNNPVRLTLTPDGRQAGVLCLELERNAPTQENFNGEQVATLAMIDLDTLEVRTRELASTVVSFVNNIVFSADGATGYFASALTDELIRFDVESLEETGPRLKFIGGIRPSSVTPSPDGSYLAVVQVGSARLPVQDVRDQVALVDLERFEITRSLIPESGPNTDQPLHDFVPATNFAFSPDGKYGLIADQFISSRSAIPQLSSDRAWLVDLESFEITAAIVGGVASGSYWSPTGEFLVVGALELSFVDPETARVRRIAPLRSDFRPSTRPAFSADGKWLYIGAPISDVLIPLNLETNEIPRFIEVGGLLTEAVEVSGQKITYVFTSAPLELAFTPDNEVLVSVNFNATTIDLIRNTEQLVIPRVLSDTTYFTGIALTNVSDQTAEVIVTGLTSGGIVYSDDPDTEEIEFENPRQIDLLPGNQLSATSDELILSLEDGVVEGWFDIDSDLPGLRSFFLTGDRALKRLDGAVALRETSQRFIVPEVRVTDGMRTELVVNHRNRQSANFTAILYNELGEELASYDRQLASRGVFFAYVRDPFPDDAIDSGIFPESAFEDFVDGYIVVTTGTGIMAYERYFDDERLSTLNAFPVSSRDPLSTRFFLPQVALFQGNDTTLKLVNSIPKPPAEEGEGDTQTEDLTVTALISLLDDNGNELAAQVQVSLGPGESLREGVAELFGLSDPGSVVSGWLEVEADKEGLVGDAEFQLFDGKAMATVPLQSAPSADLLFSHVAVGLGVSTGLALINPGPQALEIVIEVFKNDGERSGEAQLLLEAGSRKLDLLRNLIEDFGEQLGGYIRVTANGGLIGLELFFSDNLEYVAAVPPQ